MMVWLCFTLFGMGYLALAYGWTITPYWQVSVILLILTPLSLVLVKRKLPYASDFSFALGVMAAAFGLTFGMSLPLALAGLVFLLAAWDLEHFARRLAFAAAEDNPPLKERRHLLQLSLVILLGLGGSLLALNIRFKFNFELALLLALLVFASLIALVNWLRHIER